jgi:hypothetical protein
VSLKNVVPLKNMVDPYIDVFTSTSRPETGICSENGFKNFIEIMNRLLKLVRRSLTSIAVNDAVFLQSQHILEAELVEALDLDVDPRASTTPPFNSPIFFKPKVTRLATAVLLKASSL